MRTDAALQALRTRWVGRNNSWIAAFMEALKTATPEQKKALGRGANELKKEVEAALAEREAKLAATRRPANAVDITLPGRVPQLGYRHPLSLVRDEVIEIFTRLGYQVLEGPEIEDDYHNFEALNMPAEHPARDMQDTLYLQEPLRSAARRAADRAADAAAARTPARCRSGTWRRTLRRCGWSRSVRCIARTISTSRTRRCSTRSKAWSSARASRSPT